MHQQLGVDPQLGNGLLEVLPSVPSRPACTLQADATLPSGAQIHLVTLNGSRVPYTVRDTNAAARSS